MEDKDKYSEYEDAFNESNNETNQYYDMVKEQKFDQLLDKEVQLENAKAQALKNSQNTLNAQGFGSQGYGSSMTSGIYGRYMNAFNENERDYQAGVDALESERNQALKDNKEEAYQQVVSLMSSGSNNMERVNEYLASIGLGTYNAETNEFTWNEKPKSMSNADWTQLKYLYNLQNDTYNTANATQNYATYNSLDSLNNATYLDNTGNVQTLAGHYDAEIRRLWHEASNGNYNAGDTIKVTNGENQTIYLEWTNSGFRMVSQDSYNNAKNKYEMSWNNNNKSITYSKKE